MVQSQSIGLTERRPDESWSVCVDRDAVLAVLQRGALRQAPDSELARAVGGLVCATCGIDKFVFRVFVSPGCMRNKRTSLAYEGRRTDDAASLSLRYHLFCSVSVAQEDTSKVHRDNPVELVDGD